MSNCDSDQTAIDSCLLADNYSVDAFVPEKQVWIETMADIVETEIREDGKKRMRSSRLSNSVHSSDMDENVFDSFFERESKEKDDVTTEIDNQRPKDSKNELDHIFSSTVVRALQNYVDEHVTASIDDFQRQWEQTPYMAFFDSDKRYKSLVTQVAYDFKRFFFEQWSRELRSQRPNCSAAERLEVHRQLEKRFKYYERQIQVHCEKIETSVSLNFRSIRSVLNDAFIEAKWQFQSDQNAWINDVTLRMELMEQKQAILMEKIEALEKRLDCKE